MSSARLIISRVAFDDVTGQSRILYYWDQSDPDDDALPAGGGWSFSYGHEYQGAEFDAALAYCDHEAGGRWEAAVRSGAQHGARIHRLAEVAHDPVQVGSRRGSRSPPRAARSTRPTSISATGTSGRPGARPAGATPATRRTARSAPIPARTSAAAAPRWAPRPAIPAAPPTAARPSATGPTPPRATSRPARRAAATRTPATSTRIAAATTASAAPARAAEATGSASADPETPASAGVRSRAGGTGRTERL